MSMKKLITAGIAAAAAVSVTLSAGAVNLGYSEKDVAFYMSSDEEVVVSAQVNFPGTEMDEIFSTVFEAKIPAGALEEGPYAFSVVSHNDIFDGQKAIDALHFYYSYMGYSICIWETYAFDICFYDKNKNPVSPENVKITMKLSEMSDLYDVFIEEPDGSLTRLDHSEEADGISFVPPHLSKFYVVSYVFMQIAPPSVPPVYDAEAVTMPETDDDTNKDHTDGTNSEPVSETTDNSKPLPKPDDKGANTGDSGSAVAVAAGVIAFAALGAAVIASKAKKTSK